MTSPNASPGYSPLADQAARQLIDASALYAEFERTRERASRLTGGMYWKKQGEYEYLMKTYPDNRAKTIGPRDATTEQTYQAFTQDKTATTTRLRQLREALRESERVNKALRVGRTPAIVVNILLALEQAGLAQHFILVGTHALYAYETAAGVRITPAALATRDVDLLWDARKKLQFFTTMTRIDTSMLGILQQVDPSFERNEEQKESAINAQGFQVDFLRRMPETDDPHPLQLTGRDGDLFAVPARRASILAEAPPFHHPVVSATGKMVTMRTIDPAVFSSFKRWLTRQPDRPPVKRNRDRSQANIVQRLLDAGLLASKMPGASSARSPRH